MTDTPKPPPIPRRGAYLDTDQDVPFGGRDPVYGPKRESITWEDIQNAKRAPNPPPQYDDSFG